MGDLYTRNEKFGEYALVLVYIFREGLKKEVKPELGPGWLV